ncbi:unnamed protein product, partial [Allacma fusca]
MFFIFIVVLFWADTTEGKITVSSGDEPSKSSLIEHSSNYISKLVLLDSFRECSAVVAGMNEDTVGDSDLLTVLSQLYTTSVIISGNVNNIQGSHNLRNRYIRRTKKFLASCNIVIANVETSQEEALHSSLTQPVLFPLTIRNQDFYIFRTPLFQMSHILLHGKIVLEFKFKIALAESGTGLIVQTACICCGIHGSPSVVTISGNSLTSKELSFPEFFRNLRGKVMRAVVFSGGYSSQLRCEDGHCAAFKTGGVALRGFLVAADHFNFTHKLWPSKMGGRKYPNGTWYGITGDVLYDRADFGLVNAINMGRMSVVDLSYIIQYVKVAFVYIPPDVIYSWKSIFWPLSTLLWFCVGISTLASMVFLYNLNKFSRNHFDERTWSFSKTIEFLFSSYLLQVPIHPVILPVRVFASC